MKPTISKVFYLVAFLTVAFVAYVWYKEKMTNQVVEMSDENGNKIKAEVKTESANASPSAS